MTPPVELQRMVDSAMDNLATNAGHDVGLDNRRRAKDLVIFDADIENWWIEQGEDDPDLDTVAAAVADWKQRNGVAP